MTVFYKRLFVLIRVNLRTTRIHFRLCVIIFLKLERSVGGCLRANLYDLLITVITGGLPISPDDQFYCNLVNRSSKQSPTSGESHEMLVTGQGPLHHKLTHSGRKEIFCEFLLSTKWDLNWSPSRYSVQSSW